ncbi:MAG: DNA polymerase [Candidatus Methanoperedens sp.]|nr:DNA polymerase [Candidatus Methanoperedens sp.]
MKTIYFDSETTGLEPFSDRITLIQTYYDGKIRFNKPKPENITRLKNLLETTLVVGHNLKFDLKFLKHHFNIEPTHLFDTYIAEVLISGGQKAGQKGASTLETVAWDYAGIKLKKDQDMRQSFKGRELTQEQIEYAAMDVAVLPEIHAKQQIQLKKLCLEKVFATEMSCIPATVWLELSGTPIDLDGAQKLEKETRGKLELSRLNVLTILKQSGYRNLDLEGMPAVNLNSPAKLLKALKDIGLELASTNVSTLSAMKHPAGKALKEYRKHQKLLNTFLEKLPKHINPATGRIHANFNQYGTLPGRFSCSRPNLQQLPKDKNIRALFKGNNGSKIITADYSQIELRILAEVSKEPKFLELFNSGGDLHKLTASLIFNKQLDHVSKEERNIAKTINFGISYGMGGGRLQANLKDNGIEISPDEARKYIDTFFKNYPKVKEYLDNAGQSAVRNSQIRNIAGRLIKYRPATNESERADILREGKNNPIQSLNADILKGAMGRLYHRLKTHEIRLINIVHDELVFEVPGEHAETASLIVKEEMEAAGREYLKSVPVIAEVKVGDVWQK